MFPPPSFNPRKCVRHRAVDVYTYITRTLYKILFEKRTKMNYFEKLLKLLEKGESLTNPFSGIIGKASGILNMLGIGRKRQMEQQKEMVENAAKINYKYGEMAAENAFERQQVLYNRTYQDQSYASQVAQMDAAGLSPGLMYGKGGAGGGGAGSTTVMKEKKIYNLTSLKLRN